MTCIDFSNPNPPVSGINDDSWGPIKSKFNCLDAIDANDNYGNSLFNRADDRVNKKPY